jgi:hypothetical protein
VLISCLCPTFNRFTGTHSTFLMNEAVESFLNQSIPGGVDRELIVLNDTPNQRIEYDHPKVKIINLDERMPTLSDKLVRMIEVAQGDFLCRWDDDDINLPWRLKFSLEKLLECGQDEWRPSNYWYDDGDLHHVDRPGNTHVMALWKRSILDRIGGYPAGLSGNEDQAFNKRVHEIGIREHGDHLAIADIFYLYRWGVSHWHLSGQADWSSPSPHQGHWDSIGKRTIQHGTFTLRPHWRHDYTRLAMLKVDLIETGHASDRVATR